MRALTYERSAPRFVASRVLATVAGAGRGAAAGPLRLVDHQPPPLPGPDWVRIKPRLAGICGSDLATMDGRSSRYFEDIVSFPFVPGHEVVGVVDPGRGERSPIDPGTRVVVEPVLSCWPRGIDPVCPSCSTGRTGACERVAFGHVAPGLQIGFCADTGGGWSAAGLVAHESQVHRVPDGLSDEDAVLVEPTACAVHAALAAGIVDGAIVAVIGAGTLGCTVLAATRQLTAPGFLVAGAKHPHQRSLALDLGADAVVPPGQLAQAVRRRTGSLAVGGRLTGGADVVFDCVGSAESLADALAMVRPRGRIVLVGMPGPMRLDLVSLWHREVELVGAYAYGTEELHGSHQRTFDLAFEVVAAARLGRLVSAGYPLERFEEALAHAGAAGRRGAVKVVFDLRPGGRASGQGDAPRKGSNP